MGESVYRDPAAAWKLERDGYLVMCSSLLKETWSSVFLSTERQEAQLSGVGGTGPFQAAGSGELYISQCIIPIAHHTDILSLVPIHGFTLLAALLLNVDANIRHDNPADPSWT